MFSTITLNCCGTSGTFEATSENYIFNSRQWLLNRKKNEIVENEACATPDKGQHCWSSSITTTNIKCILFQTKRERNDGRSLLCPQYIIIHFVRFRVRLFFYRCHRCCHCYCLLMACLNKMSKWFSLYCACKHALLQL